MKEKPYLCVKFTHKKGKNVAQAREPTDDQLLEQLIDDVILTILQIS